MQRLAAAEHTSTMSSRTQTGSVPSAPSDQAQPLAALRAELDALDDALHDTLMRRAEVVGRLAEMRIKDGTPLRPGREAAILHRLLARHRGGLPKQGVVRIWRELFAATTAMQRPLTIAVSCGETATVAREQFGALVAVRLHATPSAALHSVATGLVAAAVLPVPAEGRADAGWWPILADRLERADSLQVIARLPFWAPRPEGASQEQALVVAAIGPDPSGQDRTLLVVDTARDGLATERILAGAGLDGSVVLARHPHDGRALVDVSGFVTADDQRLAAVEPRPVVIGAYAVPIGASA